MACIWLSYTMHGKIGTLPAQDGGSGWWVWGAQYVLHASAGYVDAAVSFYDFQVLLHASAVAQCGNGHSAAQLHAVCAAC